jgi:hypothetical protein
MKLNDKKLKLLSEGFSTSWILTLNKNQIDLMYTRLVESKNETKEQTAPQPKVTTKTVKQIEVPQGGQTNVNGMSVSNKAGKTIVTTNEGELEEKAVSKKQQEFFGVVRSMQKGDIPKKGKAGKAAKDMSKTDVKDFASTKHKGLPKKVKKEETNEAEYLDMIGKAFNKNLQNKISDVRPQGSIDSLEESLSRIIEKNLHPRITKEDLVKTLSRLVNESPQIAEPDVKPDVKPGIDTPTKPEIHPQDDPLRPGRRTIPRPAPQAKSGELPNWLTWNSIKNKK